MRTYAESYRNFEEQTMLKELREVAIQSPGIIVADLLGWVAIVLASLAFLYF